jgi:hypothetical protein
MNAPVIRHTSSTPLTEFHPTALVPATTPAPVQQGPRGLAALYGTELYLGPWHSLSDAEKTTQMAAHQRALADYEVRYRHAGQIIQAVLQASQEPLPI